MAGDTSSSTDVQIRIDGLRKYSINKEFKKRLEYNLSVKGIKRCKKQPDDTYAFVYFDSADDCERAKAIIEGHVWKGATLSVRRAHALDPERFAKRQRQGEAGTSSVACGEAGVSEIVDSAAAAPAPAPLRSVADCVTPLHGVPYEEQLQRKRQGLLDALRELPTQWKQAMRGIPPQTRPAWSVPFVERETVRKFGGAPCEMAPIIAAPCRFGYRNKCEFSFGRDADGRPCLGFQRGKIVFVGAVIGPPDECPNVSDEMKAVVARVQAFLDERAAEGGGLQPFDKLTHAGFWRQLLVRQAFHHERAGGDGTPEGDGAPEGDGTPKGDGAPMLLVVSVQPSAAPSAAAAEAELQALLTQLTAQPLSPPVRLSLAVDAVEGPGESVPTGQRWLQGPPYIEERLHELTFRVSPAAFFQVNTTGAEALCSLLRTLVAARPQTVLLDVCCGTGTLGLSLAGSVQRVIGIEVCAPAVEDARANAARNGITNATFLAAKAEVATRSVLEQLTDDEKAHLVAIVDPPRAGLQAEVLKALRACLPLTRIIYVSCHAPSFVANAVPLCRPTSTSFAGAPFVPAKAFGLDLFPHTPRCELIVLLERAAEPPAAPSPLPPLPAPSPLPAPAMGSEEAAAASQACDADAATDVEAMTRVP